MYNSAKRDYFENWTIAYIVDVSDNRSESVTNIKLNFESTSNIRPFVKHLTDICLFSCPHLASSLEVD